MSAATMSAPAPLARSEISTPWHRQSIKSPGSRYRCQALLHQTLLGDTILAMDMISDGQLVVLKRTDLRLLAQKQSLQLDDDPFREIQVISHLRQLESTGTPHPNIVRYRTGSDAIFTYEGNLFFVMEYCEDGDLCDLLKRQPENRFHEYDALILLDHIASGVAFLHTQGFAHRDLSLENVVLHHGIAKICDFGLSVAVNDRCRGKVGKVFFMAPEIADGDVYDPVLADVWSIGIIFFILLTGSPLISNESRASVFTIEVVKSFGIEKIIEAWQMDHLFSRQTIDLLDSMLQVDPRRRPTVRQILHHPAFSLPY